MFNIHVHFILVLVIFVAIFISNALTNEPDKLINKYDYLKPCKFVKKEKSIYCGGSIAYDLKGVFSKFSKQLSDNEKHFNTFHLNNTAIEELVDNMFDEITFDKIVIQLCSNLKQIHRNAFNITNLVTKTLEFNNNFELGSTDNSIFDVFSSFPMIEDISLSFNNITEIPSNAFKPINGYQKNLKRLLFGDSFKRIGTSPFFNLDNLDDLVFNTDLESIPENAFSFKNKSDLHLDISFVFSHINSSVFKERALFNIRRPTTIHFNAAVTYLDEKVFLPFLMDNENNTIKQNYESFDCNDCRNYWLKKQPKLVSRVIYERCSNGKLILDPSNFKNCSSLFK